MVSQPVISQSVSQSEKCQLIRHATILTSKKCASKPLTHTHTYTHITKNASEKNVSKWCPHFQPLWEFCFLRRASARTELPSLTYSIPHHQLVTCDGVISSRKLRTRLRRTPITFTPSHRLYVGHDNNTISFSKRFSVSIGNISLFQFLYETYPYFVSDSFSADGS